MSLEQRVKALERLSAKALPVYAVTFEDGSRGQMDALGLLLHLAAVKAGRADTKAIISTYCTRGTLPTGIAWDSLREQLQTIREKGEEDNGV